MESIVVMNQWRIITGICSFHLPSFLPSWSDLVQLCCLQFTLTALSAFFIYYVYIFCLFSLNNLVVSVETYVFGAKHGSDLTSAVTDRLLKIRMKAGAWAPWPQSLLCQDEFTHPKSNHIVIINIVILIYCSEGEILSKSRKCKFRLIGPQLLQHV